MRQKVFIDANFFCALHNKTDSLHQKATRLAPKLSRFILITSNFVLLESYTIISQRASKEQAIKFNKIFIETHSYEVIWINKIFEETVWNIFASIKDKNFSYVDASTLAVMQKEKITHLLSFDREFKPLEKKFSFTLVRAS